MRKEIIDVIEDRISNLKFKPNNIGHGMSGSFLRFQMYLETINLMTEEEFFEKVYDEYLYTRHGEIYNKVHGTNKEFDGIKDYSLVPNNVISHTNTIDSKEKPRTTTKIYPKGWTREK